MQSTRQTEDGAGGRETDFTALPPNATAPVRRGGEGFRRGGGIRRRWEAPKRGQGGCGSRQPTRLERWQVGRRTEPG